MKAAIYCRKSTSEERRGQSDELKSCAMQARNAQRFAQMHGWQVVQVFRDDAVSGATLDRPAFNRLKLALGLVEGQPLRRAPDPAKLPFQIVIMRDQSRLVRNGDHASLIIKRLLRTGVRLAYYNTREVFDLATYKPLVVGTQALMDAQYREAVRENVRETMREYAARGKSIGGICPFGYSGDRIDRKQARIVRRIFRLFVQGYGPRDIAPMLGSKPKRWAPTSIWDLLRNERYAGSLVYGRTTKLDDDNGKPYRIKQVKVMVIRTPRPDLRIVSPQLWAATQRRLAAIRRAYFRSKS